RRSQT
ncbi:UDP-N-acetylmuramoylalanine--D-glutamate ligase domain protein, partial [Chlamydia psittaci 03DC29]